jgi:hypothetical protein
MLGAAAASWRRPLYATLGDAMVQVPHASVLRRLIETYLPREPVPPVSEGNAATVKTGANSDLCDAAKTGANSVQAEAGKVDGACEHVTQCEGNDAVCKGGNQQPPEFVEDAGLNCQIVDVHRQIADLYQRMAAVEAVCFDLSKCQRDPIVHLATARPQESRADAKVHTADTAATTQDNGAHAAAAAESRTETEARTAEPEGNGTKTETLGAGTEPIVDEIGTEASVGFGTVTPAVEAQPDLAGHVGLEHDLRAVIALVVGSLRAQLAAAKTLEASLRAQLAAAKTLEASLRAENVTACVPILARQSSAIF